MEPPSSAMKAAGEPIVARLERDRGQARSPPRPRRGITRGSGSDMVALRARLFPEKIFLDSPGTYPLAAPSSDAPHARAFDRRPLVGSDVLELVARSDSRRHHVPTRARIQAFHPRAAGRLGAGIPAATRAPARASAGGAVTLTPEPNSAASGDEYPRAPRAAARRVPATAAGHAEKEKGGRPEALLHEGCEKVESKGTTTYNEVADELVAEFSKPDDPRFLQTRRTDEKNIRRR